MKKLLAGFVAFSVIATLPAWQSVQAQSAIPVAASSAGGQRHAQGLALEYRGRHREAFVAFLDAAEQGYPPAQRRLGEIYDEGNVAVKRNYEESIRWYQKAREGGEDIPSPPSYGTFKPAPVRTGP